MLKYKRIFIIIIIVLSFSLFSSCQKDETIKPWPEFYISDHANALLNSTKHWIAHDGLELYEWSKDDIYYDEDIQGAQVVVLTLNEDSSSIDSTDIFNDWGIGENDLGIFFILFFQEDSEGELIYQDMIYEIGATMGTYISMFELSGVVNDYFGDELLTGNIDAQLIQLYQETIARVYDKIYDTTYTYDIQDFLDIMYDDYNPLPSETDHSWFDLPPWLVIVIAVVLIIMGFSGKGLFYIISNLIGVGRNSGGGGKSRGYWSRR